MLRTILQKRRPTWPACVGAAAMGVLFAGAAGAQNIPPRLDPAYPNFQPSYPDQAQVNGEEGSVLLDVHVAANGKVRTVRILRSSGFDDLDNAAVEGVMAWRYIPALRDGNESSEWTKVTITYRLPTAEGGATVGPKLLP